MRGPSQRRTSQFGGSYHDRIPLEDDYEVVQARTASLTSRNGAINSQVSSLPLPWTIGTNWAPEENFEFSLDPNDDWFDETLDANVEDIMDHIIIPKTKNKRSDASVSLSFGVIHTLESLLTIGIFQARPQVYWMEKSRNRYLDEMIRSEGRGDFARDQRCPDCVSRGYKEASAAQFRCQDCFLPDLTCAQCFIRRHRLNPFHNVEVSASFQRQYNH